MTGGAVVDRTFACPVGHPFSMGAAQPVALLPKMALAAELVTVVEIDLPAFFVFQVIPFLRVVAVDADQPLILAAMFENDVAMGQLGSLLGGHRLVGMAAAAFVAFNLGFSG